MIARAVAAPRISRTTVAMPDGLLGTMNLTVPFGGTDSFLDSSIAFFSFSATFCISREVLEAFLCLCRGPIDALVIL